MPNNFYNFMFKKTPKEEEAKRIKEAINFSSKALEEFLSDREKIYHTNFLKVYFARAVYKIFYPHMAKRLTKT